MFIPRRIIERENIKKVLYPNGIHKSSIFFGIHIHRAMYNYIQQSIGRSCRGSSNITIGGYLNSINVVNNTDYILNIKRSENPAGEIYLYPNKCLNQEE